MNQRPQKPRISDSPLDQLRVPPHSIEAEQSVLGGLLLDNQAWDRMGDLVAEADFYPKTVVLRLVFHGNGL